MKSGRLSWLLVNKHLIWLQIKTKNYSLGNGITYYFTDDQRICLFWMQIMQLLHLAGPNESMSKWDWDIFNFESHSLLFDRNYLWFWINNKKNNDLFAMRQIQSIVPVKQNHVHSHFSYTYCQWASSLLCLCIFFFAMQFAWFEKNETEDLLLLLLLQWICGKPIHDIDIENHCCIPLRHELNVEVFFFCVRFSRWYSKCFQCV